MSSAIYPKPKRRARVFNVGTGASFGAQAANAFLAGPTTGAAAVPTFRSMVIADLPVEVPTSIVNDTNITASVAAQVLTFSWAGQLSVPRGGTGFGSYTTGDILYADSGSTLAKLAGNTATSHQFLKSIGTGAAAQAPTWAALELADLPVEVPTSIVNDTNVTASIAANVLTIGWSGLLAVARGGTGVSASTGSGSSFVLSTSPTFTTDITTPLVIGGTGAGSTLTLESTSGVGTTDAVIIKTGSQTERLRVDTNGYVTGGYGAVVSANGFTPAISFAIDPTTQVGAAVFGLGANASPAGLAFVKNRGASPSAHTIVAASDQLGGITFAGSDGVTYQQAAAITAEVDGTPGANDMPGRLKFYTTPDGSTTLIPWVWIDDQGSLSSGGYAPYELSGAGYCFQSFNDSGVTYSNRWAIGHVQYGNSSSGVGVEAYKTRGAVPTTHTAVQNGDNIWGIYFAGDDGTNPIHTATIECYVDGAVAANQVPSMLTFSTSSGAAGDWGYTERLRISSTGLATFANNVQINGSLAGNGTLSITTPTTVIGDFLVSQGVAYFSDNTTAIPYANTFAAAVTWNFTGGQGEVALWNTYVGNSGTQRAFAFHKVTGTGVTQDELAYFDCNGNLTLKSAAKLFVGDTGGIDFSFGSSIVRVAADGRLQFNSQAGYFEFTSPITGGTGAGSTLTLESTSGAGTSDSIVLKTGSQSTRVTVDTNGQVAIGSVAPVAGMARLQVGGTTTATSTSAFGRFSADANGPSVGMFKSRSATEGANYSVVSSGDTLGTLVYSGADGTQPIAAAYIYAQVDGTPGTNDMPGRLLFATTPDGSATPSERVRIDSTGVVTIGGFSAITTGLAPNLQVAGTGGTASLLLARYSNDVNDSDIYFLKSRNGTIGSHTVVAADDNVGHIHWQASDGTGYIELAGIKAYVDGTPGVGDMPGRLVFLTTPDGSSTAVERLRINNAGAVQAWVSFGYGPSGNSIGGTVTQVTSKATGVTLNKICGDITTHSANLVAWTYVNFTVTNSTVAATDNVIINHISGGTTGSYTVDVTSIASGSFQVSIFNRTGGDLAETLVLHFSVIKSVDN